MYVGHFVLLLLFLSLKYASFYCLYYMLFFALGTDGR